MITSEFDVQAKVKMQNGVTVVYLSGRVDVETAEPFRAACLRELRGQKIIFDFSALIFVGSQGLLPFLETLQNFHELNERESLGGEFKFTGVGCDFRKLFAATPLSVISVFETVDGATASFYLPKISVQTASHSATTAEPLSQDYISLRPSLPVTDKKSAETYDPDADSDY